MADLSKLDIWSVIPPEEKLELMARAQSAGVFAALIAIIIGFTVAVSLKFNWIIWGTLAASPFIYQFASGKKWRDLRPRTMLEYLAARSASRRYAFLNQSKNMGLQLMFKGHLEQRFNENQAQEELEAAVNQNKEAAVWVSLFNDIVVMISEKPGGAQIEFAHLIDEKLSMTTEGDGGDYSSNKTVVLQAINSRSAEPRTWALTSRHPAALVVFEKKLKAIQEGKDKLPAVDGGEIFKSAAVDSA